jgi:hypothetical protein
MGRDSLLEFHTQPLGCVHAWGVARARHARVSVRNGPFRTIPDSLRSPQGFEMRVARPHRRFSTVENRCDRKPKVSIQPAPSHKPSPTRSQTVHRRGLGPITVSSTAGRAQLNGAMAMPLALTSIASGQRHVATSRQHLMAMLLCSPITSIVRIHCHAITYG